MERLGTVAIIGVGLIGGSIGLALRQRRLSVRVIGIGRDLGRLDQACSLGAIDDATTDLRTGVREADIVAVCTPVSRIAADVIAAAAASPPGTLITDAGSTKRQIVVAVEADTSARRKFVPAHPIAGSERKGATHAQADLFEKRVCVLTPTRETPEDRLVQARDFWSALGLRLVELDPADHDLALAYTSHLPHAIAAALAGTIPPTVLDLAAGAYRDGTRVAGSDADLWTGIFLANRQSLLHALRAFRDQLDATEQALEAGNKERLVDLWNKGRSHRLRYDALNHPSPTVSEET